MTTSRVSSVGVAVSLALLLANCGRRPRRDSTSATTAGQDREADHRSADLIGGPLARGRVGDYLLKNDKIRTIIRQPGRGVSLHPDVRRQHHPTPTSCAPRATRTATASKRRRR